MEWFDIQQKSRCSLCKYRDKYGSCRGVEAPGTPYYPPPEAWCPRYEAREGDDHGADARRHNQR